MTAKVWRNKVVLSKHQPGRFKMLKRKSLQSIAGKTITKVELMTTNGQTNFYFFLNKDKRPSLCVSYDSLFDGDGNYFSETQE